LPPAGSTTERRRSVLLIDCVDIGAMIEQQLRFGDISRTCAISWCPRSRAMVSVEPWNGCVR
jgi:hypothetical protein